MSYVRHTGFSTDSRFLFQLSIPYRFLCQLSIPYHKIGLVFWECGNRHIRTASWIPTVFNSRMARNLHEALMDKSMLMAQGVFFVLVSAHSRIISTDKGKEDILGVHLVVFQWRGDLSDVVNVRVFRQCNQRYFRKDLL